MAAGSKVSFIIGGKGLKPDQDFKHVSPGRFTKASRGLKAIPANMTRINEKCYDNTLRFKKEGEWPN